MNMRFRQVEVSYYDNRDVHIVVEDGDRTAAIKLSNEDAQRLADAIQAGREITIN